MSQEHIILVVPVTQLIDSHVVISSQQNDIYDFEQRDFSYENCLLNIVNSKGL